MTAHREFVIIEKNKYHTIYGRNFPYGLKIYQVDSMGIKYYYDHKDITYNIGRIRSNFVVNYIEKTFNGRWSYTCKGFFFENEINAEKVKEWLEAQMLLQKLKNN